MIYTNVDTQKKYVKMKPEVYEHLAKTFLDRKNKKIKFWIIFSIFFISCFIIFLIIGAHVTKRKVFGKSLRVVSDKIPIVIEYDFTSLGSAKLRTLTFNLYDVDLSDYNLLNLSIRSGQKSDIDSTIKVEIENSFLEKDIQYLTGINNTWKRFSLPLKNFKSIINWSSIKSLTFTVEDWNAGNKKDKIYIDEISFIE